jgi:hypothetical protein
MLELRKTSPCNLCALVAMESKQHCDSHLLAFLQSLWTGVGLNEYLLKCLWTSGHLAVKHKYYIVINSTKSHDLIYGYFGIKFIEYINS